MYIFRKLFSPEIFQGKYKSKNYFEGWYYKLVSQDEHSTIALIPGISYDKNGEGNAFIQVIDSMNYQTKYFKYDVSDFKFSEKELKVRIKDNLFTQNGMEIDISDETFSISGKLDFYDKDKFPKKITRPGIMGPFSFVPFMECYHGVVNIDQKIKGQLKINDRKIDFDQGYGYIEKDWGRSFPKWWIWLQSNNFKEKNISLMFSVARIPWIGRYFTGFLSFLKIKDKMYLFSTYTGAKIKKLDYNQGNINIVIRDRKYILTISGKYNKSGVLKAPKNGLMERKISESISSEVKVVLKEKNGKVIFEDFGKRAGLEVVGKHLL